MNIDKIDEYKAIHAGIIKDIAWDESAIRLYVEKNANIRHAAQAALEFLQEFDSEKSVNLVRNGVSITVEARDTVDNITEKYSAAYAPPVKYSGRNC